MCVYVKQDILTLAQNLFPSYIPHLLYLKVILGNPLSISVSVTSPMRSGRNFPLWCPIGSQTRLSDQELLS